MSNPRCPKCGKRMLQEAEACDECWLRSDLMQAEARIEELERELYEARSDRQGGGHAAL